MAQSDGLLLSRLGGDARTLCKRTWWVFLVGGIASVIFGLLAGGELYGIVGVLVALPTMAAGRAMWEFFSERLRFDPWDDDGVSVGVHLDEPPGSPADVPLPG